MVGMEKRCAEIRKHLDLFIDPGQITELRAFRGDRTPAASVLYRDLDAMARRAVQLDEESGISGVFFVPNPIKDDVLTPKCPYRKGTANAQLIRERHWLLIDVDAVRVDEEGNRLADQDQPTTDAEREAGWAVLERCRVILEDAGFQGQIVGSSGNCWHLSYPVSLSNDQAAYSSVSSFLAELEDRCGDQRAHIDQKPKDAPRLWKIPGTRARKGKESPGRPWRYSWIHQGTRPTPEVRLHNNACLERLLALWRGQRAAYATPTRTPSSDVVTRARLYIEKEDPAIQGNDGSGKCFHVAGILTQGFLLSDSDAMAAIQDWNARCQPPWSEGELLHKFNDARESSCDQPLGYLLNWEPAKTPTPSSEWVDPATSDDPLDQDATAADLIAANVTIRWAWDGWLPQGVLSVLASEPGVGKTRFCADLARRIYLGMPWPDGAIPTFPAGSTTLWVPADNQHAELGTLAAAFGIAPESIYLNARKRNPFCGTMLDAPDDLKDFEARILRVKPAVVFIDTSLNATDRSSHKPEDAKAFFVPLQQIAARTGVAMVCVTHLNAAGKPLGRRIQGQARLVMQLERPDPSQEHRRKLHVVKSNSLYPMPLGITMGDGGNEYDFDPPQATEEGPAKRPQSDGVTAKACHWLETYLFPGPRKVTDIRTASEQLDPPISSGTLYKARAQLGVVEYTDGNRKWWKLPDEVADERSF